MQKDQTSHNMELVSLDGATPDDKLIDSGIYEQIKQDKEKKKPGRAEKIKGLDKKNEKRPEK